MSIAKFDLYNPEWLELVFDDRNKAYGAYDLRKHYATNLTKAMGIAFFSVALLYTGYEVLKPKAVAYVAPNIEVPLVLPPIGPNHHVIVPPSPPASQTHVQVSTVKYPILKVEPDDKATDPPKIIELQTAAISTQTSKGKDEGFNIDIPESAPGSGNMQKVTESGNETVDMRSVEILPQPYGGAEAWSKFLQKNLRYPQQAIDAGKQGKVNLSFIVEKDGHISDIVVDGGIGYGLDEEAVRVLKLAPAWKPGIQNGHPVRVKYTIPFNFKMPDPD